MMKRKKMLRVSAFMLIVALLLTCMPMNVFAASPSLNYEQENFDYQIYENKNVFLNNHKKLF